ncbi:MAG: agmatine deiminase family protein [Planctomycetes bacterium]|nr:agmatine deiminase family protein [Planctomycetota bacterium]
MMNRTPAAFRNPLPLLVASGVLMSLCAAALAAPEYPETAMTPKGLTLAERQWLQQNPLLPPAAVTPPPSGPVRCASEYEPMEGIILAWEGPTSWTDIVAQMAAAITTSGNALAYVGIDAVGENTTCNSRVSSFGGNTANIRYVSGANDTIWIRDYGPRYIFEGDSARPVRGIVDHSYNRPRPNDDNWDSTWSTYRKHKYYELPLIHGGGNMHLNGIGAAFATQLIVNENPGRTAAQIIDIWRQYQNINTSITLPFPTNVDITQHIDMWMYISADDAVLISDWDQNRGSTQDTICNSQAASMAGSGYRVVRVPARSIGGTHYTYTNAVMCNDIVLVPKYPTTLGATLDNLALAAWQNLCPGKTIIQINCEAIVTSAGVMHCICMHVPKHKGRVDGTGLAPTVYQRTLRGGQIIPRGGTQNIDWTADDDQAVSNVTVSLSLDGGSTWSNLATNIADSGRYVWTVPTSGPNVPNARIRVTARDAGNRTDWDPGVTNFFLGTPCVADINLDDTVDFFDYLDFVQLFATGSAAADFNADTVIDFFDYLDFVSAFAGPCQP